MKLLLSMQITLALFAALAFTQFASAQESSNPPATYTYKAVNVPGAGGTLAYGISNSDEVVGFYTPGCSESNQTACGFTLTKGVFSTIVCATENATNIFDISFTSGEIVGTYSYFGGVNGFIWEGNDSCFPLSDPNGSGSTEAWGANDSGLVVGFYSNAGNFVGFEYTGSTNSYADITCPGWTNTRAYGINNAGIIVGDVANSSAGPFSGMAYKAGKCTIFNYPDASSTFARGINNKNQISGFFTGTSGTFGFVKTGSTYTEIDYPASVSTLAYHLNDAGLIAGFYGDAAGATHGFVAIP